MESIFSNYGIEIVVGMIFTVLAFLLFRVIYYGCIKKWKVKQRKIERMKKERNRTLIKFVKV